MLRVASVDPPVKHSDLCKKIWNAAIKLQTKDDLEKAIQKAKVVELPPVSDEMVSAFIIFQNKRYDSLEEFIEDKGTKKYRDYMKVFRAKLKDLFEMIRST